MSKKESICPVLKVYIPILLGGFLVAHWWWSALHPFIESSRGKKGLAIHQKYCNV
ncbi:MAG: hypothetical protein NWF14_03195 [Candidatus Bathyarchaeota archaeon]|nr:hypothetical protein [Candidatus Bathyarchaeota archaeon]